MERQRGSEPQRPYHGKNPKPRRRSPFSLWKRQQRTNGNMKTDEGFAQNVRNAKRQRDANLREAQLASREEELDSREAHLNSLEIWHDFVEGRAEQRRASLEETLRIKQRAADLERERFSAMQQELRAAEEKRLRDAQEAVEEQRRQAVRAKNDAERALAHCT